MTSYSLFKYNLTTPEKNYSFIVSLGMALIAANLTGLIWTCRYKTHIIFSVNKQQLNRWEEI